MAVAEEEEEAGIGRRMVGEVRGGSRSHGAAMKG